jgi:hypothetical protein
MQYILVNRKEVVEFAENNSTLMQAVIAEKFGQEFGLRISKQIISGWIKDTDKYLKIEEVDGCRTMK